MTILDRLKALINDPKHDPVQWRCDWKIAKFEGDWSAEEIDAGLAGAPVEVIEREGNLLMTNGANALWTALTGGAITAFSNANAYIGVGDSSTAEAAGQTDLQAASNKTRVGMDATYPIVSTNQVQFRATFGAGSANYVWAEWAVFNASAAGTMLNRKVAANGTKSGGSWQLLVTLSLS